MISKTNILIDDDIHPVSVAAENEAVYTDNLVILDAELLDELGFRRNSGDSA